jgi:hypothetical protein|tara:strand:+ start:10684 stop:11031 length:348 start_codon:yes stop_codon:yes gene_type:complete
MDKSQIKLISNVPSAIKVKIVEIIKADPKLKPSLDRLSKGLGTIKDVKIFNNMRLKADTALVNGEPVSTKDITEDAQKGSWWSKQKKGTKIAIIGGGALAIGLGVFAFIKSRNKK